MPLTLLEMDCAPQVLKIFANRNQLGFDEAAEDTPTQEVVLTEKDFNGTTELKFVKFQSVSNLTVT